MNGSRYDGATMYRVLTASGERLPALYSEEFMSLPVSFDFTPYRVVAGDRLDLLADRFYGDVDLWWILARANPEISYPDDIEPGLVIRIPGSV